MILRLKDEKKYKGGSVKADVVVEIDSAFKLLTRSFMEYGDGSIDFGPMDKEMVAEALTHALGSDYEIKWCDGLWRFAVNWYKKKGDKPPHGLDWRVFHDTDKDYGFSVKWGTVETVKASLPAHVVEALEKLSDSTEEIMVRMS